jgi:hypothetical protein
MRTYLNRVRPGTRFRVTGLPELVGTLIDCSDCSANVEFDGGTRDVEFEGADGQTRHFRACRKTRTTIAPGTLVDVLPNPNLEDEAMAKKQTSKKTTTKKSAATKGKGKKGPALHDAVKAMDAPVNIRGLATAPKESKKAKPAKEPKAKKVGCLEAAAQILVGKTEPMTTVEMIEAMEKANLWKSPGGKTPHATLYSAIIREIATKGKESRFAKADRGKFSLA